MAAIIVLVIIVYLGVLVMLAASVSLHEVGGKAFRHMLGA